ncbi:hypothetical protein BDN70DRAFT_939342 [Pholiota conissans]|uniref:Uncharacterized protein n=1 Tax=Pholiota conissans TaxID=109636 RepID=A0A9P5YN92_9AGAR|nr:hypothetical protein BDN70DRAFT_939342 [Pholiota conissans]
MYSTAYNQTSTPQNVPHNNLKSIINNALQKGSTHPQAAPIDDANTNNDASGGSTATTGTIPSSGPYRTALVSGKPNPPTYEIARTLHFNKLTSTLASIPEARPLPGPSPLRHIYTNPAPQIAAPKPTYSQPNSAPQSLASSDSHPGIIQRPSAAMPPPSTIPSRIWDEDAVAHAIPKLTSITRPLPFVHEAALPPANHPVDTHPHYRRTSLITATLWSGALGYLLRCHMGQIAFFIIFEHKLRRGTFHWDDIPLGYEDFARSFNYGNYLPFEFAIPDRQLGVVKYNRRSPTQQDFGVPELVVFPKDSPIGGARPPTPFPGRFYPPIQCGLISISPGGRM